MGADVLVLLAMSACLMKTLLPSDLEGLGLRHFRFAAAHKRVACNLV